MQLKNKSYFFILACLFLTGVSGILLSQPALHNTIHQDSAAAMNISDTLPNPEELDTINQTNDSIGSHETDSVAEPQAQTWRADFYKDGFPIKNDTIVSVEVEVFINHELLFAGQMAPQKINDTLRALEEKHNDHKTLELIVLNRDFDRWLIHLNDESEYHQSEEVSLLFFPGETTHYKVELTEAEKEIRDHHVYYIAISGWQESPREILNFLDTTALMVEDPFLVHFYGPTNSAIIINHDSSENERAELRSGITETTQPPISSSGELRELNNELNNLFAESNYLPRLYVHLILSESTYHGLVTDFIDPFLASISERMELMELVASRITFVSDFDIQQVVDESEEINYNYINLSTPQ